MRYNTVMLKYSKANAKTKALANVPAIAPFLENRRAIYSLDLLAGWSCPYALECLSKVHELPNGKRKLVDGPHTKFRCFSASQEVLYPKVYDARKHNYDILKKLKNCSLKMFNRLREDMPKNLGVCRIHVDGDFFNFGYMLAWATMAEFHPDRLFYAYTKSLPFWVKRRQYFDGLPNFVLTASRGGRRDDLITSEKLREAKVIFSESEAGKLEIDKDDSHAADPSKSRQSFALLLHGVQPAGSEASKALVKLKGKGSYGRKK